MKRLPENQFQAAKNKGLTKKHAYCVITSFCETDWFLLLTRIW